MVPPPSASVGPRTDSSVPNLAGGSPEGGFPPGRIARRNSHWSTLMNRQNRMIGLVAVLIAVVPVATTMGDPVGTAFTCPGSPMELGELVSRFAIRPRGCGGQKRSRMARIAVSAQRMGAPSLGGRHGRQAS